MFNPRYHSTTTNNKIPPFCKDQMYHTDLTAIIDPLLNAQSRNSIRASDTSPSPSLRPWSSLRSYSQVHPTQSQRYRLCVPTCCPAMHCTYDRCALSLITTRRFPVIQGPDSSSPLSGSRVPSMQGGCILWRYCSLTMGQIYLCVHSGTLCR